MTEKDKLPSIKAKDRTCTTLLLRLVDWRYSSTLQIMLISKVRSLSFGIKTLWTFTASDAYTLMPSMAVFGVVSGISGSLLTTVPETEQWSSLDVISSLPVVFGYLWINLLLFNVANQRLPASIKEDSINKPWRPMPSQRLTQKEARVLLHAVIPVAAIISAYTGGIQQAAIHTILSWMHNDLDGSGNPILKNLYTTLGIVCYSSGAAAVASSHIYSGHHGLNSLGWTWMTVIGAIILTTTHVQDFRDRKGDEATGRRTLPLVIGDSPSRWLSAVIILASSLGCSVFWQANMAGYLVVNGMGSLLAVRLLVYRSEAADRLSWNLWPIWIISIFIIPVLSTSSY
ncbi:unnamed protein product [Penicillium glandicola]